MSSRDQVLRFSQVAQDRCPVDGEPVRTVSKWPRQEVDRDACVLLTPPALAPVPRLLPL